MDNNICGVPKTLEDVQTIMQVIVTPFLVIKVCGPSEDTNGDLILGDLQGWFYQTLADCYMATAMEIILLVSKLTFLRATMSNIIKRGELG